MKKIITAATTLLIPFVTFAQANAPRITQPADVPRVNVTSISQINNIIGYIISWIIGLFFTFTTLMLFYTAYTYLTAGGDPKKIEEAHTRLIYSLVALAVALLAFTARYIVASVLQAG